MGSERELFVICPSCSSEVSPYVTECPYCGNRLRKRAPDLKKQRKLEEKHAQKAAKQRERLRAQYEGGGEAGAWLDPPGGRPLATAVLVAVAIVASVIAASGFSGVSEWMLEQLVYTGKLASAPWKLVSSPFLQYSFGYGFVCLGVFALFGAGIERRFGALATLAVWLICGASGVFAEAVIAPVPVTFGAYSVAVGTVLAWTVVVAEQEDLRDHDTLGLGAVAFVLCALPLATDAARVSALIGGIAGGLICGFVLSRLPRRG
jgi:membrane associated rhomboid family serine protease